MNNQPDKYPKPERITDNELAEIEGNIDLTVFEMDRAIANKQLSQDIAHYDALIPKVVEGAIAEIKETWKNDILMYQYQLAEKDKQVEVAVKEAEEKLVKEMIKERVLPICPPDHITCEECCRLWQKSPTCCDMWRLKQVLKSHGIER